MSPRRRPSAPPPPLTARSSTSGLRSTTPPPRSTARPAMTAALALTSGLSAALTATLAIRLRSALPGGGAALPLATLPVDGLVEVAVLVIGTAVAAWLSGWLLVATSCALLRTAGSRWRAGERLVLRWGPAVVRRMLVVLVGTGLGLGATVTAQAVAPDDLDIGWVTTSTATATPSPGASAPDAPSPATSAPVTAAPTVPTPSTTSPPATSAPATTGPGDAPAMGAATAPGAPPGPTSAAAQSGRVAPGDPPSGAVAPSSDPTARTVEVRPGDSLWLIAARHLPPGADDADVAAAWPAWYAANAQLIGADPGLIRPGQTLRVPAGTSIGTTGVAP